MKKQITFTILSLATAFFSFQTWAQQTTSGTIISEEGYAVAKYELYNPTCFNSKDGEIVIRLLDGATGIYWSDGTTLPFKKNLKQGEYHFKLQLAEYMLDYSLSLESPEEIIGTIHEISNLHAVGLNLEVEGGIAPYSFKWNNGSTTQNIENITSSGVFEVTIKDKNSCIATSSVYVNKVTTPSADDNENMKIGIDHANNLLTLKGSEIKKVVVIHESGIQMPQVGDQTEYGVFSFRLPKKGLYIITLFEEDEVIQKKIYV